MPLRLTNSQRLMLVVTLPKHWMAFKGIQGTLGSSIPFRLDKVFLNFSGTLENIQFILHDLIIHDGEFACIFFDMSSRNYIFVFALHEGRP